MSLMLSNHRIESPQALLSFIKEDANDDGNLSTRGVAKLAGVEHTSIIRGGAFASLRLDEMLTSQGFEGGALAQFGFCPQAVILVLEYFAFESRVESPQARAILRAFGSIGLATTLEQLKRSDKQEPIASDEDLDWELIKLLKEAKAGGATVDAKLLFDTKERLEKQRSRRLHPRPSNSPSDRRTRIIQLLEQHRGTWITPRMIMRSIRGYKTSQEIKDDFEWLLQNHPDIKATVNRTVINIRKP